jgi:hypothetical protein
MADLKISALPASTTPLAGTEVLPIVQSSATKQVSIANLTAGRAISATQITLTAGNVIPANGYGIDFSATAGTGTSELLADYEEGTWTPNQGAGLTVVGTFGSAGTYTKVGRIVTVNLSVTGTTSIAVTAGGAICSNLPFTAIADGIGSYGGGAQVTTPVLLTAYAYVSTVTATNASGAGAGLYMTITYTQG